MLLLCGASVLSGCRRAAPPTFTPGPEVVELTAGIDDEEELQVYQGLQEEIATKLRELCGTPTKIIQLGQEKNTDQLKHGFALYTQYCVQCHGVNGDGNGAVAEHLNPKPRNYTVGVFKFTSTPVGSKPRRADLMRTVRNGVTGTSMPSFDRFSETELEAVIEYVLALTYRGELETQLAAYAFDDEELPDEETLPDVITEILEPWQNASEEIVMPVSAMPPMTEESVKIGHQIFLSKACNKCHGKFGRGGSVGNVEVGKDVWENEAAAADLSSGMFRGGDRPIDLYRRIYSGINGTPMPPFSKMFEDDPDAIWHLVHFIKATGNRRRQGLPPLSEADLPTEIAAQDQAEAAESVTESADSDDSDEAAEADTEETDAEDTDSEDEEEVEATDADGEEAAL